jgi:hypothetical protein
MTSKALESIKERNAKVADDAALEALAAKLDSEAALELTQEVSLDEAMEAVSATFVESNVETPYANIVNTWKDTLRPAHSVITGEVGVPAILNTNPQPVRVTTAPAVDRSNRVHPSGVTQNGKKLERSFVGNYDVVMFAPSHRNASDTVLVNALLDRINPEFVIHGGGNGADAMARTWCHSREVEQVECIANWGDGASTNNPALGSAAGPIRNNVMLDLADELQEVHGKRVVVFSFTLLDQQGRDPIVQSFSRANAQRNAIKGEEASERQYIIPLFEASEWLNDDFRASLPVSTRGKVLEYEMPLIRS